MNPRGRILRVLVTRPLDDARELAALLTERGHVPIVAPMLTIRFYGNARAELAAALEKKPQAWAASSANGVRALAGATERRDLPLFVVGEASAAAAAKSGFARIVPSAGAEGGDAATLAEAVRRDCDPTDGPVIYLTGTAISGDLTAALERAGFDVRRIVLYDAVPAPELPPDAEAALCAGSCRAALFYSRRTAEVFAALVRRAGLERTLVSVTALCLSPAVAEGLAETSWLDVKTPAIPVTASVLARLGEIEKETAHEART